MDPEHELHNIGCCMFFLRRALVEVDVAEIRLFDYSRLSSLFCHNVYFVMCLVCLPSNVCSCGLAFVLFSDVTRLDLGHYKFGIISFTRINNCLFGKRSTSFAN